MWVLGRLVGEVLVVGQWLWTCGVGRWSVPVYPAVPRGCRQGPL